MPSLLERSAIESIHEQALSVLATIGVAFETEDARNRFKKHGAKINGQRVLIESSLLTTILEPLPEHVVETGGKKRLAAASPFSNAPMVIDDATGRSRRGTVQDAVKLYQLAETSPLYASINAGVVDPEGNDGEDPYIAQIAMLLKYSDKFPSLALRATRSNTHNGDLQASAGKAIRLIKEIKGDDRRPVMGQGNCPMSPLGYDDECLINLTVMVQEGQAVTLIPCSLTFMTGPESLLGTVVHDLALCLAGAAYVQLLKPGTPVAFTVSSTMTDMQTLQPAYGSPEYLYIQTMFYEVCRYLGLNCVFGGGLSDGTTADYQAGYETCLTAMAPFFLTDAREVWCTPGHMAAYAAGSFKKMILDEALIVDCNRVLQGLDLAFDPLLKDKLAEAIEAKSFLSIGSPEIYRREHRTTKIFDKSGVDSGGASPGAAVAANVAKAIEARLAAYALPERSPSQKTLLNKYLPSQCRY